MEENPKCFERSTKRMPNAARSLLATANGPKPISFTNGWSNIQASAQARTSSSRPSAPFADEVRRIVAARVAAQQRSAAAHLEEMPSLNYASRAWRGHY
ncbi:hypothetical protein VTI28DRAFT_914 [Corynascus sepedonium]